MRRDTEIVGLGAGRHLRLAARMRLKLESELEACSPAGGFKQLFAEDYETYSACVRRALTNTLAMDDACEWFDSMGVEIATWHYRTRCSTYDVSPWLTGQFSFSSRFRPYVESAELLPYPEIKSPYIDFFADEQKREQLGIAPICILLPAAGSGAATNWSDAALEVPWEVTAVLTKSPQHSGAVPPLGAKELRTVCGRNREFVRVLQAWMKKACRHETDEIEALNNLQASLKVTLLLLKDPRYGCGLPRSTFLSPAYVASEEVGGIAFACSGLVSRETACVGDSIATSVLSYLRLREDALAQVLMQEKELLDQAKRFFIGRLVHDFRHPVDALASTVHGFVATLSGIDKQIEQIGRMMDDTLLAVEGHDPQNILKPKKRIDNLSELLADVVYYFRPRFEKVNKKLSVGGCDPQWEINVDRGMFQEVLDNLISNALEHGGSQVRIDVDKVHASYCVHVRDNGPGIPPEVRANIFRPFFRLRVGSGSPTRGRGLAISRMLAEAQGGSLSLQLGDSIWKTDFELQVPE